MKDKVAVVSGVGPGVGVELARLFLRDGAKIVMVGRNAERLRAIEEQLGGGDAVACVPGDISSSADCDTVAAYALERFGQVDILVNNAFQMGPTGPVIESVKEDSWNEPFDVNVAGSLRMTRAFLPALKASRGSVVIVNTVAMRTYKAGFGSYAISKGALQSAARYLAVELAEHGIRVNSVVPGYIDGPPLQGALEQMAQDQGVPVESIIAQIAQSLPLKRIPTSADVAEAVLFLASSRAAAITGASLDVNGGEFIPL